MNLELLVVGIITDHILVYKNGRTIIIIMDWEASEMHVQVFGQEGDRFERSVRQGKHTHQSERANHERG